MSKPVKYTDPTRVLVVSIVDAPPRRTAADYGTFPTRHMINYQHDNGRVYPHRVYALCYGNGASLAIKIDGGVAFIDLDTQERLAR